MSKRSARVAENESAQELAKSKIKSATNGEFGLVWKEKSSFYALTSPEIVASTKIAAFDMDHTLVCPKNPKSKFPANRGDWVWWNEKVPEKLKELRQGGFNIVIFTNQGGIEKGKQNKSDITGKILDLASALGFPIQAFVAAAEDHYRKPFTTMWDEFIEIYNGGIAADVNLSFYCGDAAGRLAEWKKGMKKDFSAGDRQFAFNIGLPFKTPEHLFLEEKETDKWSWECFNPSSTLADGEEQLQTKDVISKDQEMVILVGRPASGKSTFTNKHFVPNGYIRVNRDQLGTQAKCKKAVELALSEGKSVVIDNTNPSQSGRLEYILMAQAAQVPVRCFYFETSVDLANHLNFVRVKQSGGSVRRIPPVGYHTYNKNFDAPELSEGFSEVRTVKFVPQLDDADYKKIFLCKNPKFGK